MEQLQVVMTIYTFETQNIPASDVQSHLAKAGIETDIQHVDAPDFARFLALDTNDGTNFRLEDISKPGGAETLPINQPEALQAGDKVYVIQELPHNKLAPPSEQGKTGIFRPYGKICGQITPIIITD